MKRMIAMTAVAALALAATPALAKSKKHYRHHHAYHAAQPYYGTPYGGPWVSRNVSDPSMTSPNFRRDRALGRCVEDLGYGRYEYCDW
jgi:hypothetical protein